MNTASLKHESPLSNPFQEASAFIYLLVARLENSLEQAVLPLENKETNQEHPDGQAIDTLAESRSSLSKT